MRKIILTAFLVWIFISQTDASVDSLIFKNNNYIVGEVKSLSRNVLVVETDYSDDDFTVEWDGVKEIYTETYFLISLTDGNRYNGHLRTTEVGKILLMTDDGQEIEVNQMDIVYLDDIDMGFWSQVYASIDFGLDITRANNFRQISMRSNVGYMAKRWQLDANYNSYHSEQDEIDDVRRMEGGGTFKYFLPHDWYPTASVDFLANTEQQLQLRTTGKAGLGKYIIHTNQLYWGFSGGANYNNENFSVDSLPDRRSWEGFFGTELNMFNTGDISLLTNVVVYPSITESGRWRTDFKFDFKYDLPLDFYIKTGVTVNYDNQPVSGTPETDYVIHTGFGWEW